jgi:acetyl-CoA acetyltransferase
MAEDAAKELIRRSGCISAHGGPPEGNTMPVVSIADVLTGAFLLLDDLGDIEAIEPTFFALPETTMI